MMMMMMVVVVVKKKKKWIRRIFKENKKGRAESEI